MDDYIELPYSTVFDLGTTWTISYWIKPVSGNKTLSTRSSPSVGYETGVNVGANFFIEFYGNNSPPGGQQLTSGITPVASTWYHFVVVANGSTVKILIDSVEYLSISYSKSVTANNSPLRIGHAAFFDEGQNAVVDELRIFNRALNAAEIRSLMLNYDPGEF